MNEIISPLKPFEYQTKLKEYLQTKNKLWSWYSEDKAKKSHFENFKKNLLKGSYRIDKTSHPELYTILEEIKQKIDLPLEITIYQEQMSYQNNIGISFYENEAHIVLSGRVLKMLTKDEMKAILAHELFHYYFFTIDDKGYEIADRIITSIANDERSSDVYLESARLFKLYTELYCDRGAYMVMGDIGPVIGSLVKLTTGVDKVNPSSYLEQAKEILSNENRTTNEQSHPEAFIRAKAIELWSQQKYQSNNEIDKLIIPKIEFEKLNIFSQKDLELITKKLIQILVKPTWNKTDRILDLANEYFPNMTLNEEFNVEEFFEVTQNVGESTKKYLSYILLDFSLSDSDQGNATLGYAFELAENGGLKNEFNMIVKKELKLTARKLKDLQTDAAKTLNQVNESKEDSLYGE